MDNDAHRWSATIKSVPPFRRMLVPVSGRDSDAGLLAYGRMLTPLLCGLETLRLHVAEEGQPERSPEGAEIVHGDLLDCILEYAAAKRVDLILLGHSDNKWRRSLARRLAMKAPCSVWMMPDGFPARISRILVPIDFSQRSADTLEVATALTEAAGQDECTALHVYFNDAAATFDEFDEILVEDKERAFGIFVAPIDLHGVWAKPLFVESANVAQTILHTAAEQGTDLIVMGTRGRSPAAAVLLGSETEHTLIHTPIPLLTIKHFGARMRLMQALRDERVRKRTNERFT